MITFDGVASTTRWRHSMLRQERRQPGKGSSRRSQSYTIWRWTVFMKKVHCARGTSVDKRLQEYS